MTSTTTLASTVEKVHAWQAEHNVTALLTAAGTLTNREDALKAERKQLSGPFRTLLAYVDELTTVHGKSSRFISDLFTVKAEDGSVLRDEDESPVDSMSQSTANRLQRTAAMVREAKSHDVTVDPFRVYSFESRTDKATRERALERIAKGEDPFTGKAREKGKASPKSSAKGKASSDVTVRPADPVEVLGIVLASLPTLGRDKRAEVRALAAQIVAEIDAPSESIVERVA